MQEILKWSASDMGRAIGKGELDPVALAEAHFQAIEAHEHSARIYSTLTKDRAIAEAEAASERARNGHRRSLLDGVPISWKDLFDTAGTKTEAGTKLLEGRVPERDAKVLSNAANAGLVCLGKTHMTEFAFSGLGMNPMTATPPNIHDPGWAPGGSSSGAATSVAFGLAAAGIGSDTGGSVRIPSAWNDLVGFKTTHGWLSLKGVVSLSMLFDSVGPLCRTVEDATKLSFIMAGELPPELKGASLRGKRLMILRSVAFDDIRAESLSGFDRAVERLRDAGAEIVEAEVEAVSLAMPLSGALFASEAYGQWREVIEAAPHKMFHQVLERFRSGANFSGPDYAAARNALTGLRAEYAKATAGYDAVLLPTSPILPPNAARLMTDKAYFVSENLLALRNTRIGNLMGLCALTIPTGTAACGLMAMAGPGQEARLARIGSAIEAALR